MHNHYAFIYNELVWNVLKDRRRRSGAVRAFRLGGRTAVPGALGRRLLRQL